jgi:hypothetical protein
MKTGSVLWPLLICLIVSGCNIDKSLNKDLSGIRPSVDTLARDAGRNLASGLSDSATLLVHRVIAGLKGITDTLDPDIRKIYHVIDSLGTLGSDQIMKMGDSLDSQITRLKGKVDSKKIQQFLVSTVEKLTGTLKKRTKDLLTNMIQSALNSLKTDSSKQKVNAVIANLLDDSAKVHVQSFLAAALSPTIDTLTARIHTTVHEELPFVKRQAVWLLVAVGLIAAAIIGWVWYQRSRYARLVEILTYHIDQLTSKDSYNELTGHIQQQTKAENLEPLLRQTLKKQGINQ